MVAVTPSLPVSLETPDEYEFFTHAPAVLARHCEIVEEYIKCTLELLAKDGSEKLIEEKVVLERTAHQGARKSTPETYYGCHLPPGPELENALSFGCKSMSLITSDASGQPAEIRLMPGLKDGGDAGFVLLKLPEEMANPAYHGTLKIRPASSNEMMLETLTLLKEHPERYPIETAVQLFTLQEGDIKTWDGPPFVKNALNAGQQTALQMALTNAATIIWGPPGTGKSHLICQIMDALLERKADITLISNTNSAIDSVAGRLATISLKDENSRIGQAFRNCRITRYGTPVKPRQLNLISYNNRRSKAKDEKNEEALPTMAEAMKGDSISIVTGYRFISNRSQKFKVDSSQGELPVRDVVIIDEISTVSLPLIYVAACFARQKIIVVGDDRQLPVIFNYSQASRRTREAYSSTIFRFLKLRMTAEEGQGIDLRMSVLTEQRRMRDGLAALVRLTGLYPAFTTPTDFELREAGHAALQAGPFPGQDFVILDTAGFKYPASQKNTNHAHLELGKRLLKHYMGIPKLDRMGVICPYRNQIMLYRDWLRPGNDKKRAKSTEHVTAGTVHAYQGSEAPLIVWDTVESESPSGEKQSHFFTDELSNPSSGALNLMNVAVSRSQGKLVVLMNVAYIMANLTKGCYLQKLVHRAENLGVIISADQVIEDLVLRDEAKTSNAVFPALPYKVERKDFQKQIKVDLDLCRDHVSIFSPEIEDKWLLTVARWFYAKSIDANILINFYTKKRVTESIRAIFQSFTEANSRFRWKSTTEWPFGEADVVLDNCVFYYGAPALLVGKVDAALRRSIQQF